MFLDKVTSIVLMYSFTKLAAHKPRKESLLGRNKVQWLRDLTAGEKIASSSKRSRCST